MGRDKALLELGGQPVVLRTVERLRPLAAEITLVGSPERYAFLGLPVLADCRAECGPLAGIVTALRATRQEWNLILACDLPFVGTRFLAYLLEQAATDPEADAVVPRTGEGWQPLCAAYHRRCLGGFERVLESGDAKITNAFGELKVRKVTPDELQRFAFSEQIFKNMNTPEEYAEAVRVLRGRAGS